jgi:hypothetical protein
LLLSIQLSIEIPSTDLDRVWERLLRHETGNSDLNVGTEMPSILKPKAHAPESTPEEPSTRPMTSLLVQFAKPSTSASENDMMDSGESILTGGSRCNSLKEVDLANTNQPDLNVGGGSGNDGGAKSNFSDRAFVEDHVKHALNEGKMKKRSLGGGGSIGSSSSSLGSNNDAHKYISIALLVMTMVVGMIVLFIDIDGLEAFYELMASSPSASYVIFIAMFGVPFILVVLISRGMCKKRNDFLRRTGHTRSASVRYCIRLSHFAWGVNQSPFSMYDIMLSC